MPRNDEEAKKELIDVWNENCGGNESNLSEQLTKEYNCYLNLPQSKDSILRVYRGQAIALDELNLIRENK
ncbi:unnamed protein product, partial [Didymodactylos carnosus]